MNAGERLLAAATARMGDRALERTFGTRLGLRAIFSAMTSQFVPRVANGFTGDVRYELRRATGRTRAYTLRIGGDSAALASGAGERAALTLRLDTADFIRLAAGETDPMALMKTRRIEVRGDGLLAARLGPMFGRPVPPDAYVAPDAMA